MDDHEAEEVRALISSEPQLAGDLPAVAGWLQRMCRTAARDLPAAGVGISLLSPEGHLMRAAASSSASLKVEELQFSLGEGPCMTAYASRRPVLVADLAGSAQSSWPGYAPAAYAEGVRAVFAFPLLVGDSRLGAIDVYRDQAGELSRAAHDRAMVFADAATDQLLRAGSSEEQVETLLESSDGTRFEVYQAQGMVMVQLSIGPMDALARLRAHAYLYNQTLVQVAQGVIERKVVLQRDDR